MIASTVLSVGEGDRIARLILKAWTVDQPCASARADRRVRLVQRLGRRGLSSACVEGILSCSAPYVAVMDADLQHDETLLPRMLTRLKAEELDLVIRSRYAVGGSTGEWSRRRRLLSRLGSRGAQWLLRLPEMPVWNYGATHFFTWSVARPRR